MICNHCGAEVTDDAVFCHQCGENLGTEPPDPTDPTRTEPAGRLSPTEPAAEDRSKDESERTLWEGRYSSKAMIGSWIGAGIGSVTALVAALIYLRSMPGWCWYILLGAIVVLWIWLGLRLVYRRWNVRYRLTNQRLIHHEGILRRETNQIEVIDMDDITFSQGLIDRFANVGTVKILSSDASDPVMFLRGIDDVRIVADKLDQARRKERLRRGLHIESI